MNFDINNIVRSVAVVAVGLPITLSVSGQLNATTALTRKALDVTPAETSITTLKNQLTETCLKYKLSKADTKLERQSKNDIDEVFDGEVMYNAACNYVLG